MAGMVVGLLLMLCAWSPAAGAEPAAVWQQTMQMAAAGRLAEAVAHVRGAEAVMQNADQQLWRQRMQLAAALLQLRQQQSVDITALPTDSGLTVQLGLMQRYMQQYPAPVVNSALMPGLLATLLPGAGHAWQGRWRDALVAAMMVVPFLLLTLWAAHRRMGPVTLFFAMICIWLWSGNVFSALSLAERASAESYLLWWQGLWQAAALPGQPW